MYNIMHLSIYISYFCRFTASSPQGCFNASMTPRTTSLPWPGPVDLVLQLPVANIFVWARLSHLTSSGIVERYRMRRLRLSCFATNRLLV